MNLDRSKFSGCLIGQCLGDALGFPVEGFPASACKLYLESHVRFWFEGNEPSENWRGQYTDDSQLARLLLESLTENNGFVAEDYADRIKQIFATGRIVGRGIACDMAASRLGEGIAWQNAGEPAPSAGNGTAMRAAPVGLFYVADLDMLIKVAHQQGFITHQDKRCSAGSIAIAGAVALLLEEGKLDPGQIIERLAGMMHSYHEEFADYVRQLPQWLDLSPDEALLEIKDLGKDIELGAGWPGISPFVISTVLWSLYSFLKYPDSYKDAIFTSIMVGGDVDTTAAITGALSGTWLGLEGLPANLYRKVNDNSEWGFDELVVLADKCYELVSSR